MILAEYLDDGGDTRQVAAWGWENDAVFVLAFALSTGDSEDDDEGVVVTDDPEPEGWGTPEDIAAMREQAGLIPPGWGPWEGRPAEVPVVDKAADELRWVIPPALGEPVAPYLRPIAYVPGGIRAGGATRSLLPRRKLPTHFDYLPNMWPKTLPPTKLATTAEIPITGPATAIAAPVPTTMAPTASVSPTVQPSDSVDSGGVSALSAALPWSAESSAAGPSVHRSVSSSSV